MEYRKCNNYYVLRLNKGEEVIENITKLCQNENILLGTISGIGATNEAVIGLFDINEKMYYKKEFKGLYEITSLMGNITRKENEVYLHLHINIGDDNQNAFGGHLNKAVISATAEIVITVIDGSVNREFNSEVGLNLLKFE